MSVLSTGTNHKALAIVNFALQRLKQMYLFRIKFLFNFTFYLFDVLPTSSSMSVLHLGAIRVPLAYIHFTQHRF